MICPSHDKLEHRGRIGLAAPLLHTGIRSLRHALSDLLSRKTLGKHCAAGSVGTGTRIVGPEKFLLLWGSKTGPSNLRLL
jgi:hypothetical protein